RRRSRRPRRFRWLSRCGSTPSPTSPYRPGEYPTRTLGGREAVMGAGRNRIAIAIGVVAAGLLAWLLPVVAATGAQAATNDIVVPQASIGEGLVIGTNASRPMAFGMQSPASIQVCKNCQS